VDEEGFTAVVGRSRRSRREPGRRRRGGDGAAASAAAAEADTAAGASSHDETVRAVRRAIRELEATPFWGQLAKEIVGAAADSPLRVACLGLGSPSRSSISQWQLACLVLLRGVLGEAATAACLDPAFDDADASVLADFGIKTVTGDLGVVPPGRTSPSDAAGVARQWAALCGGVRSGMLLFMPHCPAQLYDKVLDVLGHDLAGALLVGNALSGYGEDDDDDGEAAKRCPAVRRLLAGGQGGPGEGVRVTERRVDALGCVRACSYGGGGGVEAAEAGGGGTLALLGLRTHPSARGDPVLLAFTRLAVHVFEAVA